MAQGGFSLGMEEEERLAKYTHSTCFQCSLCYFFYSKRTILNCSEETEDFMPFPFMVSYKPSTIKLNNLQLHLLREKGEGEPENVLIDRAETSLIICSILPRPHVYLSAEIFASCTKCTRVLGMELFRQLEFIANTYLIELFGNAYVHCLFISMFRMLTAFKSD